MPDDYRALTGVYSRVLSALYKKQETGASTGNRGVAHLLQQAPDAFGDGCCCHWRNCGGLQRSEGTGRGKAKASLLATAGRLYSHMCFFAQVFQRHTCALSLSGLPEAYLCLI